MEFRINIRKLVETGNCKYPEENSQSQKKACEMDETPYQYQKIDRSGRLQVSRGKLAKSKKKLVRPMDGSNSMIIPLLFNVEQKNVKSC